MYHHTLLTLFIFYNKEKGNFSLSAFTGLLLVRAGIAVNELVPQILLLSLFDLDSTLILDYMWYYIDHCYLLSVSFVSLMISVTFGNTD
jgi:hypothetical protein